MKRELLQDLKIRQIKYFGHIKRHDTLIKQSWRGRSKDEEQTVDPDTNGRMTSRDGRSTVWQSVTSGQEIEDAGDPLQPTLDAETAHNDEGLM
jgi:hypothetical protein